MKERVIDIKRLWAIVVVVMLVLSACDQSDTPDVARSDTQQTDVNQEAVVEEMEDTKDEDENTSEDLSEQIEDGISIENENSSVPDDADSSDIGELEKEEPEEPMMTDEDYSALGVNELGHIMVVMYHGIKDNPPYHRTKDNFIKDLTYMYENGYRLVSMSDYLNMTIDIEAGKTPIVLTFDDGLSTTFSLIETDNGLEVDPDSAIGLLEAFIEEHPDFGRAGALFIHDTKANFRGDGTAVERLKWLIDKGYEIGNHSATHADLSKLDEVSLIKEIGQVDELLLELELDITMSAITYPYGKKPNDAFLDVLSSGQYKEIELDYQVGFREGPSSLLYCPLDIKFIPFGAPRVRGSEGEIQDMWWFFEHYDVDHPELKYVSDGDPETVVIPAEYEERVNMDKIGEKELIIY